MVPGLQEHGFSVVAGLIDPRALPELVAEADRVFAAGESTRRRAGVRGAVTRSFAFARLALADEIMELARRTVGQRALLVRSILFDKTEQSNWDVPWHRDTTIVVKRRVDVPGYGPWSNKDGAVHVQPPVSVLANMVTVRIHLDDCPATNGALLVVPGSHRNVLDPHDLSGVDPAWCDQHAEVCEVEAGGCLVMRPLLLHASRKSAMPGHRRVLHLEFAAAELDGGLAWARH